MKTRIEVYKIPMSMVNFIKSRIKMSLIQLNTGIGIVPLMFVVRNIYILPILKMSLTEIKDFFI